MLFTKEDKDKILELLPHLDYSGALCPFSTKADVIEACNEVKKYGFATVCVYPTWVKFAAEQMKGSKSRILVTIGFPHGSTTTETKVAETRKVLEDGGTEIDMVINIARMLEGDYDYVRDDIAAVVKTAAEFGVGVKAIIETGYLNDDQKVKACELAVEAGAQFVKSCTGYGPGKATVHDISLMKQTVGDRCLVKASGGVGSLEDAWIFVKECGAERAAGRQHFVEQLKRLGIAEGE